MTHAHDPHLGVRQGMTHDPHLGVRQGMMRDPHLGVRHSRRQGMTHECTTLTWGSGTCYNNMCACDCALTVPCGFALRALFRVPGFHGFQGSRVSWAPGFQGSRVPGFQGSRVSGVYLGPARGRLLRPQEVHGGRGVEQEEEPKVPDADPDPVALGEEVKGQQRRVAQGSVGARGAGDVLVGVGGMGA